MGFRMAYCLRKLVTSLLTYIQKNNPKISQKLAPSKAALDHLCQNGILVAILAFHFGHFLLPFSMFLFSFGPAANLGRHRPTMPSTMTNHLLLHNNNHRSNIERRAQCGKRPNKGKWPEGKMKGKVEWRPFGTEGEMNRNK